MSHKIIDELPSKYELNCTSAKKKPWGFTLGIRPESVGQFVNLFFSDSDLKSQQVSPRFLVINPNSRLSWQWHRKRNELWRVVQGPVGVILSNNDSQSSLEVKNNGFLIEIGPEVRHRLVGLETIAIVAEVWVHTNSNNPSDRDDIIRVEDDYNRQK